jgi:hypothetical protein
VYKSWDHTQLDTWDEIQRAVDNVLDVHKGMMMFEHACACVGLDRDSGDSTFIEVEVQWDAGRDCDDFLLFVRPPVAKQDHLDAYDRAMGVV